MNSAFFLFVILKKSMVTVDWKQINRSQMFSLLPSPFFCFLRFECISQIFSLNIAYKSSLCGHWSLRPFKSCSVMMCPPYQVCCYNNVSKIINIPNSVVGEYFIFYCRRTKGLHRLRCPRTVQYNQVTTKDMVTHTVFSIPNSSQFAC